jgi:hypothetical protein
VIQAGLGATPFEPARPGGDVRDFFAQDQFEDFGAGVIPRAARGAGSSPA